MRGYDTPALTEAERGEAWEHPDPKPEYFSLADLFRLDPRLERLVCPEGECWVWTGYRYKGRGGGTLWYAHGWWPAPYRRSGLMHRYTYTLAWGSIAPGREVHHTCNRSLCVNPNHLWALLPEEHRAIHEQYLATGE